MKTRQDTTGTSQPVRSADVIDLTARRCGPIEESLLDILAHVRAGKVAGFAFSVHFRSNRHTVGAVGSYQDDTVLLRGVAAKLAEGAAALDEQGSR